MKFSSIFSGLFIAVLLCSCQKDNVLYYSDNAIGNVVGGLFVTDDGLKYNVVEQECDGSLYSAQRAVVISDVLKKNSDNSYDIRLKQYYTVLVKDALVDSKVTDKEDLGHNAIGIARGWASGGYLNLLVEFTYMTNSSTKHNVNLVYDDIKSNSDTLKFTLMHNGYGETYEDEGAKDLGVCDTYISFPVEDLIPSGKDQVVVKIDWKWHVTSNGTLYPEIASNTTTGTIKRTK